MISLPVSHSCGAACCIYLKRIYLTLDDFKIVLVTFCFLFFWVGGGLQSFQIHKCTIAQVFQHGTFQMGEFSIRVLTKCLKKKVNCRWNGITVKVQKKWRFVGTLLMVNWFYSLYSQRCDFKFTQRSSYSHRLKQATRFLSSHHHLNTCLFTEEEGEEEEQEIFAGFRNPLAFEQQARSVFFFSSSFSDSNTKQAEL